MTGRALPIEWGHDSAEEPSQSGTFARGEGREDGVLTTDKVSERGINASAPRCCEFDAHGPGVAGIGASPDEPAFFQVIDSVGHRARSDEGLGEELTG